jgi:hypothetical protein
MPPAFTLSQDQTLQFDLDLFAPCGATHLESTKNFISEISCLSYERLKVLRPSSEELGNRLQTPTLIGCMLLTNLVGIHSTLRLALPALLRSAKP